MEKINSRGYKTSIPLRGPLAHQDDSIESFSFKLPSGLLQDQPIKQKSLINDQNSSNYNCPADAVFCNGKILPHAYPCPNLNNNNPGTDQVITSRTSSNSSSSKDSFVSSRSNSTGSSSSNSNSRSNICNNSARRLSTIERRNTAAATSKKPYSLNELIAKTSEEKGYNSPRRSRAPVHREELKLKEAKVVESSSASSSVFKAFGSACRGCRVVEPYVKKRAVIYSRK